MLKSLVYSNRVFLTQPTPLTLVSQTSTILKEISNMSKNHQTNSTDDPNIPLMKSGFTRFCTFCKKSGHTLKSSWSLKKKPLRKKHFLDRKNLILKITQVDKNCRIITHRTRMITRTPKEVIVTVRALHTTLLAEKTVTLKLFALKQKLTMLPRCMTPCSYAIF